MSTKTILLTKTTAAQNEDGLSYHRVHGLYFLAVVFAAIIYFLPYERYVDDVYTLASTCQYTETMFTNIAALDPECMLQWEVDFLGFVPFLGIQIKVENDGVGSRTNARRTKPTTRTNAS